MENIFNLFRAPSINEINENYPCRAKWKSIIKIWNINNHFGWPEVLYSDKIDFDEIRKVLEYGVSKYEIYSYRKTNG